MTHLGYLIVGWGTTLAVGALSSFTLLRRGRRMTARVPDGRRRWMTADDQ